MSHTHNSITHLDQVVAQKERQAIKQLIADLPVVIHMNLLTRLSVK